VIIGLLAVMLLPALGKAKTRANRIKCVSNIKQVGGAYKAFANDNSDRYPWLLQDLDKAAQGGNTMWVNETSTLLGQPAIRAALGSAKILVSPLDPDNQGVNDGIDLMNVDIATGGVPNEGHSYGVVNGAGGSGMGADEARPGTILTVTRNISGPVNNEDSLSDQGNTPPNPTASSFAIWKGADRDSSDPRVMASLNSNAGQMGLADGSAGQSNNADLGQKTKNHHNEMGGNYKGSPSGFLDTPND